MSATPPSKFDEIIKHLPQFRTVSRPAETREERDDTSTIYGTRTLTELTREVLKRGEGVAGAPAKRK